MPQRGEEKYEEKYEEIDKESNEEIDKESDEEIDEDTNEEQEKNIVGWRTQSWKRVQWTKEMLSKIKPGQMKEVEKQQHKDNNLEKIAVVVEEEDKENIKMKED